MKLKKRPQRTSDRPAADPPRPPVPCPKCGKPLKRSLPFADSGNRFLAEVPVLSCKGCKIACARVEGIADEWRPAESPGLVDLLARDAESALRDRRAWEDDSLWTRV